MALGGCYSCIKYLMFAFNFIFWLLGCAILGVGIWLRVDPVVEKYVNQAEEINSLHIAAYVFMFIGVIIMLIGFLGCCGAVRESPWMLGVFFFLLFIIFAILLGMGIWSVVQKDVLREEVGNMLERGVKNYYTDSASKAYIDTMHNVFECCGAREGSKDFKQHQQVPDSCSFETRDSPCEEKFFSFLTAHFIIAAGVAIAVAFIMILGMIFSITLCCAIRYSNTA
ncbi:hypothetical protein ACOMHN_063262 [Nucella lapillus]